MPLVQISTLEGKSPEQIKTCLKEVTEAICRSFGSKPEAVRVIVEIIPKTHWAVAGVSTAELEAQGTR